MQFIPVIERLNEGGVTLYQKGTTVSDRSVMPEQLGNFLMTIFDEWVRNDVGKVFVQTFEAAMRNWLGLGSSGMCVFDATCGHGLALEHNGDLYSCDHFVEPDYLLGNIHQQPHDRPGRLRAATQIRPRQAGYAAALLPRMRGSLCLPWGMSQEPIYRRHRMASPASTTCARATKHSSTTSTGP